MKPTEVKSICYDNCGDDNALEGCTYWCTNSGDPVETIVALREAGERTHEALRWLMARTEGELKSSVNWLEYDVARAALREWEEVGK